MVLIPCAQRKDKDQGQWRRLHQQGYTHMEKHYQKSGLGQFSRFSFVDTFTSCVQLPCVPVGEGDTSAEARPVGNRYE